MAETTVFYQTARLEPRSRRPHPIIFGRFWPCKKPEFLDIRGEPVAEAVARHSMNRLAFTNNFQAPLPSLRVNPISLFDPSKTAGLVDERHNSRWFVQIKSALEAASDKQISTLQDLLQRAANPDWNHWRDELGESLKGDLRRFQPLFPSAWVGQVELLQADVERAGRIFSQTAPLAKNELVAVSSRVLQEVQTTIKTQAEIIAQGMSPYKVSYAGLTQLQKFAGEFTEATVVSLPGVEATIAEPSEFLIEELENRGPAVDLVILEPVMDLRLLDTFAATCFGHKQRLHGMIYAGVCDYQDERELLDMLRHAPAGEEVGQGHVCIYAGKFRHPSFNIDAPVIGPLFAKRYLLDQMLQPGQDLWGPATPLFGAQPAMLLSELDSVDTLRWRSSLRETLADLGVNCLTSSSESGVYPYRNRTRCLLPELQQACAVRFREFLAGNIRAYLGKASVGALNTPLHRRMLADGASKVWQPFCKMPGFNAKLDPTDSPDPTQFTCLLEAPTYIGIRKVVIYYRAVNPA